MGSLLNGLKEIEETQKETCAKCGTKVKGEARLDGRIYDRGYNVKIEYHCDCGHYWTAQSEVK